MTGSIPGTDENWENGTLGCDPASAVPVSKEIEAEINNVLGLSQIKFLIDSGIANSMLNMAAKEGVVPQVIYRRAFRAYLGLPLTE